MKLRNYTLAFAALLGANLAFGQAAYVLPSPTGADEPMTLFVDVAQTTEHGLKPYLEANPGSDVYLWIWQPSDPIGGNGAWSDSNDFLKMTHESGLLYSMTFVPTEFFGVDGPTFYNNGISCLAKLDDGSFLEEYGAEMKCEDLHVDIVPKLCDSKFCVFPTVAEQHDFVTITYDNNQETIEGLIGADPNEIYVYLKIRTSDFVFPELYPEEEITSHPELKMTELADEPGVFRFTLIPEDVFADILLPEDEIWELRYYIVIPDFTYSGQPPTQLMPMLMCE